MTDNMETGRLCHLFSSRAIANEGIGEQKGKRKRGHWSYKFASFLFIQTFVFRIVDPFLLRLRYTWPPELNCSFATFGQTLSGGWWGLAPDCTVPFWPVCHRQAGTRTTFASNAEKSAPLEQGRSTRIQGGGLVRGARSGNGVFS